MFSMSFAVLFGLGCSALAVVWFAFSKYRDWLIFMFAGMASWLVLELVAVGLRVMLELSISASYTTTFLLFLAGLTVFFVIQDYKVSKVETKIPNCIEHTPVYEEDDQHQYSG